MLTQPNQSALYCVLYIMNQKEEFTLRFSLDNQRQFIIESLICSTYEKKMNEDRKRIFL